MGPVAPGVPVPAALNPEPPAVADGGQPTMPRLAGLSLRQAMAVLAPFGVQLEIAGRGIVAGQSPLPGAPLPPGTVCRLHLAPAAGRVTPVAVSLQP